MSGTCKYEQEKEKERVKEIYAGFWQENPKEMTTPETQAYMAGSIEGRS